VPVPPEAGKLTGFALVITIWQAEEFSSTAALPTADPFTYAVRCPVRKEALFEATLNVTVTEVLRFAAEEDCDVASQKESDAT
jgi:hypothetical protein